MADEGTEKHRHACADGGRVGIRPGPDRSEPWLDAALVASVQLLGSGVASSRGSMPGQGVDASVSLASCWLCLASIAAGHRQRRDAVGPGHPGRPMGTRQQRNSRQKQRREVNREPRGRKTASRHASLKTVPGQDKRTALSLVLSEPWWWWVACSGGHRDHHRRGCQRCHWLNCRPATCRRWQDFGRRGSVVSTHDVTPWPRCLLVAMNPSNVQAGRSVEGLNAKECVSWTVVRSTERPGSLSKAWKPQLRPEQSSWKIGPRGSVGKKWRGSPNGCGWN